MPDYIVLPLEIFAIGFVISLTIACLIKLMLVAISFVGRKNKNE